MQTDLDKELAMMVQRLTPRRVGIFHRDDGRLELLVSLVVVDELEGQRWRRIGTMWRRWHERVERVTVHFPDNSLRAWSATSSMSDDGLWPKRDGPVEQVILAFLLPPDPQGVAEELAPVQEVVFDFTETVDVARVVEPPLPHTPSPPSPRRCLRIVRVPPEERGGY